MTSQPLVLRRRPDLVAFPQSSSGARYWVVKDPLALRYHRLGEEEYALLGWLDGRCSREDLRRRFETRFAPQRLSSARLQQFLATLFGHGLLVSESGGQGDSLWRRRAERRRLERRERWANLLAIRVGSIDPSRGLAWLAPKCRWLFSPACVVACVLLMSAALGLVTLHGATLFGRLPEWTEFFGLRNAVWLVVSWILLKGLHELGHALACRHFGGECHELGLMALVFTPCLYCDVSDSWTFASRWQRVAVAAAGMYVEALVAACCTLVWWFSQPGGLQQLCLNLMFVGSISTLLFNGNPLLRYDAYFVLSDLLDAPNLSERSRRLLRQILTRWCLGVPLYAEEDLPERRRGLLAVYGVASTIYRGCLLIGILWFLHATLRPYGLALLARLLTFAVVAGLVFVPLRDLLRMLRHPGWRRQVRRGRLGLTGLVVVGLLAALCLVPLPHRVRAPAVLQPQDAHRVYVTVPGRLVEAVELGRPVQQGQTLVTLVSYDMQLEIARLSGRRAELQLRLHGLEAQQAQSPEAAVQIPAAREELADIERRWEERRQDARSLTLTAPVDGVFLAPPRVPDRPPNDRLPTWTGVPSDEQNRGSYLETGTLVGLIGDPQRIEAVLAIDQTDVESVRIGQRAWIALDQRNGAWLTGEIAELSKHESHAFSWPDTAEGSTAVPPRETDRMTPARTGYWARVTLAEPRQRLLIGARGRARIGCAPRTLGWRVYQYLARTFALPL
jgi:putative peptide zinc metalloprotease protein